MSDPAASPPMPAYPTREPVDFVIVGSGAAGGVVARELSKAGFSVVLLEQGPHRTARDFNHDELSTQFNNELLGGGNNVQTYRRTPADTAKPQNDPPPALYSQGVGGSSVHFSGNFWRMRPVDFAERIANVGKMIRRLDHAHRRDGRRFPCFNFNNGHHRKGQMT